MLNDCSYDFEMIRLPVNGNKLCNKPGIDAVKDVSPYQGALLLLEKCSVL